MLRGLRWRLALPLGIMNLLVTGGVGLFLSSRTSDESFRHVIMITSIVAGLAVLFLTILLTEPVTHALKKLVRVAQSIPGNQAEISETITSQNEIQALARTLSTLATQWNERTLAYECEQSRLAAVLAQSSEGNLTLDSLGQIELCNPAAQKIFRLTNFDPVGKSLVESLRNHQLVELWQKSRRTGATAHMTLEFGPERLILEASASPLSPPLSDHTLLLVRDISQLRLLETVRKDFVSNISHEIRTPLASLKALTETLLDGALDDPIASRRFLTRIETEVDALSLLVQELLELSKIESGGFPLHLEKVDPAVLMTSASERIRMQAERAGLSLGLTGEENLPVILADPRRLEQVLVNLIHNAIKFTPPGGKVIVSAAREQGTVVFQVHDTGAGIPSEVLPRIFERFYKADPARSTTGTGLGLAICRHLVQAHGGHIWAESVEGQGSDFFFSIPVADEPP